jgi:hypothetical protein
MNENIDKRASSVFYNNDYDGIFFVFDLCDYSTLNCFHNVRQSLNHLIQSRENSKSKIYGGHLPTTYRKSPLRKPLQNLPVLLIGNNSLAFNEYTSQAPLSTPLLPLTTTPEKSRQKFSILQMFSNFFMTIFLLFLFIFTKIFCMSDYYRVGNSQQASHLSRVKSSIHSLQQETHADYIEVDCTKHIPNPQTRMIENFLDRVIMGNRNM